MSQQRRPLPLIDAAAHSGRSAMTCLYRCGNACDHPAPNTSDNPYFGTMLAAGISRRGMVRAGALGAMVVGFAGSGLAGGPATAGGSDVAGGPATAGRSGGKLTFTAIPPNKLDTLIVPNGYDHSVVIRWGDPVLPGAPPLDVRAQNGKRQSAQFGYNCDFVGVLPVGRHERRALLVVNHEYTNEELMFPGFTGHDALSVDQLEAAMAAHGISVVEIERVGDSGQWVPVGSGRHRYNRRITALSTRFTVTGAAAGSPLLRTAADPSGRTVIGTLNNCAGGVTPWGTVLSGEENFNQYFVGANQAPEELKPRLSRYGFTTSTRYPGGSRKWDRVQERFDLSRHPNEAHRFGWVVEIDPYDPHSTPRKHTALGRFKHEGANVIIARDGRAVVYMGDDERFDYLYKFVSEREYVPGNRRHNLTLLESGTLYVAALSGDEQQSGNGEFHGTGKWIKLVTGTTSHVSGMSAAEVLTFTRQAADLVGATKMDRPEDVQPSPRTGKVYVALTNNSRRGVSANPSVDAANPRANNKHGHILELMEAGENHAAESLRWSLPIICGDPADPSTYFAGFDKSKVSPISCPDNVTFDRTGNLWICTDGNALDSNDGLFATPIEGTRRGHLKQFLTVPLGAEACGPFIADDDRSVFVAVQHPGEVDDATLDLPASTWPDGDFAKPGVVVAWRHDGGRIGS